MHEFIMESDVNNNTAYFREDEPRKRGQPRRFQRDCGLPRRSTILIATSRSPPEIGKGVSILHRLEKHCQQFEMLLQNK
jgi:hypothetical protein